MMTLLTIIFEISVLIVCRLIPAWWRVSNNAAHLELSRTFSSYHPKHQFDENSECFHRVFQLSHQTCKFVTVETHSSRSKIWGKRINQYNMFALQKAFHDERFYAVFFVNRLRIKFWNIRLKNYTRDISLFSLDWLIWFKF